MDSTIVLTERLRKLRRQCMSSIAVIGSVNLDLVATVKKLPEAGETVTDAELSRFPGGKGANQALAAQAARR